MNKLFKNCICLALTCSIICNNPGYVKADEVRSNGSIKSTEKQVVLSQDNSEDVDDTVICYMDGIAIHQYDVDENGIVKDGVLDEEPDASNKNIYNVQAARTTPITLTVNSSQLKAGLKKVSNLNISPYKNAIIHTTKHVYAQRTNQTYGTTYTYLTAANGRKYASKIEYSTESGIVATVLGFVPYVGTIVTIAYGLNSVKRAELASKIRSYTDKGKKVCIIESAGVTGVKEWTGSICTLISTQESVGNDHRIYEELNSVNFN